MMFWSVTLLAFTLVHGTTATMKSEAELLEVNGWKEMDAQGNPLYKTLASKAASNFTKHIDFYQVLNEVISVNKKVGLRKTMLSKTNFSLREEAQS